MAIQTAVARNLKFGVNICKNGIFGNFEGYDQKAQTYS